MSRKRRGKRRGSGPGNRPRIYIPPSEGLKRHDVIPTDYTHVVADLKTIAVLATVMIGGLVLLSLLIQR